MKNKKDNKNTEQIINDSDKKNFKEYLQNYIEIKGTKQGSTNLEDI